MGIFAKRKPETQMEIMERVLRNASELQRWAFIDAMAKFSGGPSPAPPLPPGHIYLADPRLVGKFAKEVKKAKDRGLLIENDQPPATSS